MSIEELVREMGAAGVELFVSDGRLRAKASAGKLSDEMVAVVEQKKTEIIHYLTRLSADVAPLTRDADEAMPLSYAQLRLWFLDQLTEGGVQYNIVGRYVFKGVYDEKVFQSALRTVLDRHEVLRTCYRSVAGEPHLVVQSAYELPFQYHDISHLNDEDRQQAAQEIIRQERATPFDLKNDLMLRMRMIKLAGTRHLMVYTMHHIASDGWSLEIFRKELIDLYVAYSQKKQNPLQPLAIQYSDYARWQREWLQGDVLERQLQYWLDKLAGMPPLHSVPLDKPRPTQQLLTGKLRRQTLNRNVRQRIRTQCERQGVTLFMFMHTAFAVLLRRYSGSTDIVVGVPIAGRAHKDVEGLIGFFVNMLVLRTDVSGNPGFAELLSANKRVILDAYAHQHLPFEMLVEKVAPERRLSHNPLIQISMVVQNNEQDVSSSRRAVDPGVLADIETNRFDLDLYVGELADGGLSITWQYSDALFEDATIGRMASNFGVLLESILTGLETGGECRADGLELLSDPEKSTVVTEWNDTRLEYSAKALVHQLFEEQAASNGQHVAAVCKGRRLSYDELNARANQIAHHLRSLGVHAETLVGLYVEPSVEMIIGLLGILKAGGAYVPIDPGYPPDRIDFLLADSAVDIVLSESSLAARLVGDRCKVLLLDDAGFFSQQLATNPDKRGGAAPHHLAYVIYTSGSTGRPKGVMVEHGQLAASTAARRHLYGKAGRCLLLSSVAFDSSVASIFGTLTSGGTLFIAPRDIVIDGVALRREIAEHGITELLCVPSLFEQIIAEPAAAERGSLDTLSRAILAGEECPRDLVSKCSQQHPGIRIFNEYGPTEATVWATVFDCSNAESSAKIAIGRPVANARVYVLDADRKPVPIGVIGELYIGGAGVTRGYLNDDTLTRQKFVANPFSSDAAGRLFKSGDLVRWLPSGDLEFHGRADGQVKIRGYRIELEEIEHQLLQLPEVAQTVVTTRERIDHGGHALVAYIVLSASVVEEPDAMRRSLKTQLGKAMPDYMLPDFYVFLQRLPLSPNGKVDRKALPAPVEDDLQKETYIAPRTEMEAALCRLYEDVLRLQRVGIHDNFFALGGHSLLGTRLISAIREELQVELPLRAVFECPTIASLSERIDSHRGESALPPIAPVSRDRDLPLSFSQQRLWFLSQLMGPNTVHNMPLAARLHGAIDIDALCKSLLALLARHEALRTHFEARQGNAVQVIDPAPATLPVESVSNEAQLQSICRSEREYRFDLSKDTLCRIRVVHNSADNTHALLVTMHHSVSDGWSWGIFFRELKALYRAFRKGEPTPLAPLTIQYADYACWQREWLQGEALEAQLSYWREQLADVPRLLSLPMDRPRPAEKSFRCDEIAIEFPSALSQRVRAMSRERGVTLFIFLLSVFSLLLSRYSGQSKVAVGTPVVNRNRRQTEGVIGFFANTIVMRSDFSRERCFFDVLSQTRNMVLESHARQECPFEQLVEDINPERSLAYSPIFQVMFTLQNASQEAASLDGMALQSIGSQRQGLSAEFDLTLALSEDAQGVKGTMVYDCDLFDAASVARMGEHFVRLTHALVESPRLPVSQVGFLTDEEKHQQIVERNQTRNDYPSELCIQEIFEQQVEKHPESVAVVSGGEHVTYDDLNRRANQLAHWLIDQGVQPDSLVAISVQRSVHMIVGLLGILKAGAAYVPIDANYPKQRIDFMLENSGVGTVLTQESLRERFDAFNTSLAVTCLDDAEFAAGIRRQSTQNIPKAALQLSPDHLAYVIYTSGSTGKPKGVMLTHRNVVSFGSFFGREFALTDSDRFLQFASVSFDTSVEEIFTTLMSGGCLLLRDEYISGKDDFIQQVIDQKITVLHLPTAYWQSNVNVFKREALRGSQLRFLMVGGEATSISHYTTWAGQMEGSVPWINSYGPTEATVTSTFYRADSNTVARTDIPIGTPIANCRIVLLDEQGNLVPSGTPAELHIGGAGLARGYLHNAALTAQRFVPDPFATEPGSRLYRTGDLARWSPDAQLEFLGRIDTQVKIRGFRVELAEIESQLLKLDSIKDAVVLALSKHEGSEKFLVAYVVLAEGAVDRNGLIKAFQEQLLEVLPGYMVPRVYVLMDELPLTSSGKIDRKALPPPSEKDLAKSTYVPPGNEVESTLCQIWRDLLDVEEVGVHANFFELGGHSLLIAELHLRVKSTLDIDVPIKDLFMHDTVYKQARCIVQSQQATVAAAREQPPVVFVISDSVAVSLPLLREFHEAEPAFKAAFGACRPIVESLTGEDIAKVLAASGTTSHEGSPAFRFSIGYSLSKWWLSVGIVPASLIGIGVGEVVAGCLSGVLDLKDAIRTVAFRQSSEGISALRQQIKSTKLSPPAVPFISRLTGRRVTDVEAVDIDYWLNAEPSRFFSAGIGHLLEDDKAVLLEVSTGSALTKLIRSNRYSRNRFVEPMFGPSGTRAVARELLAKLISSGVKREFGITA